jgi:hypothetical protein
VKARQEYAFGRKGKIVISGMNCCELSNSDYLLAAAPCLALMILHPVHPYCEQTPRLVRPFIL